MTWLSIPIHLSEKKLFFFVEKLKLRKTLQGFLGAVGYLAPNCRGIRIPMGALTPLTSKTKPVIRIGNRWTMAPTHLPLTLLPTHAIQAAAVSFPKAKTRRMSKNCLRW